MTGKKENKPNQQNQKTVCFAHKLFNRTVQLLKTEQDHKELALMFSAPSLLLPRVTVGDAFWEESMRNPTLYRPLPLLFPKIGLGMLQVHPCIQLCNLPVHLLSMNLLFEHG